MALRQTRILQPQYASQFRCIGPECEDSCCMGWSVFFDQQSCAKYESLPESPLRFKILNNLKPIPDESIPASRLNARMVQMTPANECAFLRDDRLCEIQAALGEEALSSTCSKFPRIPHNIDQLKEAALTLSCPEAARLVLNSKTLLNSHSGSQYQFNWDDAKTSGEPLHAYFWPIREFSIRLVTNRNYPLWQRLFLLGLFARRLDKLAVSARVAESIERDFGQMLNEFDQAVHCGQLRSQMVKIPSNLKLQLMLLWQFIALRAKSRACPERMLDIIRKFKAGLHSDVNTLPEAQIHIYSDACVKYYEPLINSHPHLMENYLANQIFRSLFPFGEDALHQATQNIAEGEPAAGLIEPSRSFLQLATQFALVKGILIGLAGYYREEFNLHHCVEAIQIISRNFEHHQKFLDESYALLQAAGQDTPAGFATLLRN